MAVVIEDDLLLITRGGADPHDFTRESEFKGLMGCVDGGFVI